MGAHAFTVLVLLVSAILAPVEVPNDGFELEIRFTHSRQGRRGSEMFLYVVTLPVAAKDSQVLLAIEFASLLWIGTKSTKKKFHRFQSAAVQAGLRWLNGL